MLLLYEEIQSRLYKVITFTEIICLYGVTEQTNLEEFCENPVIIATDFPRICEYIKLQIAPRTHLHEC